MTERVVIGDYPTGVFALLYLGDCTEVVATIDGQYDAIETDAPYGLKLNRMNPFSTQRRENRTAGGWQGKDIYRDVDWDDSAPDMQFLLKKQVPTVLFGGNYFEGLPPSRKWIIWHKGNSFVGRSFSEAELAWCSFDGSVRVVTCPPVNHTGFYSNGTRVEKTHPCQKPLPVMKFCINELPKDTGKIILDPFMGSGSTGVAAIELGRSFIGIEKRQDYFDSAYQRIERAYEEYNRTKSSLFDECRPGAQHTGEQNLFGLK